MIAMFCEKCGNNLPDTAKFCDKCGNPQLNPDASRISWDKEKDNKPGPGTSSPVKLRKYVFVGIVGVIVLAIIITIVLFYAGSGAGFVATKKNTDTVNGVYPGDTTIKITAVTTQQDNSWINASIDSHNMEIVVGDICTMTGAVSGTTGPITYSVYTFEDIKNKNDYSNPVISRSFSPSADGTFKLDLAIVNYFSRRVLRNYFSNSQWTNNEIPVPGGCQGC